MDNKERIDHVNHPSHYTWLKDAIGIEVIDICRLLDFNRGQVIKYILRLGRKQECGMAEHEKVLSDLQKAKYYIEKEITRVQKSWKNGK